MRRGNRAQSCLGFHRSSINSSFKLPVESEAIGLSLASDSTGNLKELFIDDRWLSKTHFSIVKDDDGFRVEDLKSTNGTYLDGQPLERRARIKSGALLRAGRNILVFQEDNEHFFSPPPENIF